MNKSRKNSRTKITKKLIRRCVISCKSVIFFVLIKNTQGNLKKFHGPLGPPQKCLKNWIFSLFQHFLAFLDSLVVPNYFVRGRQQWHTCAVRSSYIDGFLSCAGSVFSNCCSASANSQWNPRCAGFYQSQGLLSCKVPVWKVPPYSSSVRCTLKRYASYPVYFLGHFHLVPSSDGFIQVPSALINAHIEQFKFLRVVCAETYLKKSQKIFNRTYLFPGTNNLEENGENPIFVNLTL